MGGIAFRWGRKGVRYLVLPQVSMHIEWAEKHDGSSWKGGWALVELMELARLQVDCG